MPDSFYLIWQVPTEASKTNPDSYKTDNLELIYLPIEGVHVRFHKTLVTWYIVLANVTFEVGKSGGMCEDFEMLYFEAKSCFFFY